MKEKNNPPEQQPPYHKKTYFYIALVAIAAGAVAFGLAFAKPGIYALMASVLLSLAALSFLNTQKKRNNFKGVFYATVAAYILLALCLAFFIGGVIYSIE